MDLTMEGMVTWQSGSMNHTQFRVEYSDDGGTTWLHAADTGAWEQYYVSDVSVPHGHVPGEGRRAGGGGARDKGNDAAKFRSSRFRATGAAWRLSVVRGTYRRLDRPRRPSRAITFATVLRHKHSEVEGVRLTQQLLERVRGEMG